MGSSGGMGADRMGIDPDAALQLAEGVDAIAGRLAEVGTALEVLLAEVDSTLGSDRGAQAFRAGLRPLGDAAADAVRTAAELATQQANRVAQAVMAVETADTEAAIRIDTDVQDGR
ncbi:hypothetical protein [Gordonia sp. NPDC003376]